MYYIGVDVGGTNLVAGLMNEDCEILDKASHLVDHSQTPEQLCGEIVRLAKQVCQSGGVTKKRSRRWASPARPGEQQDGRCSAHPQHALSEHTRAAAVPAAVGYARLFGQRRRLCRHRGIPQRSGQGMQSRSDGDPGHGHRRWHGGGRQAVHRHRRQRHGGGPHDHPPQRPPVRLRAAGAAGSGMARPPHWSR